MNSKRFEFNFHKRTGLVKDYKVGKSDYKAGVVFYLRFAWSMWTFTYLRKPKVKAEKDIDP